MSIDIYKINEISQVLNGNSYVGRGIVIGKTPDATKAVIAYFIMGRSENSRNRIFEQKDNGEVIIYPFDASKVSDPSLIIYSPIRKINDKLIVTNGDQTDTIFEGEQKGLNFYESLKSRCFEPDGPNFTPRISGILTFKDNDFSYEMSILKSADPVGSACNRFTFSYSPLNGLGHFLHTYVCDGNPIPTFVGEPERVAILDDIDQFTNTIWQNLDQNNKISLYVRYIDLVSGKEENRLINKNQK